MPLATAGIVLRAGVVIEAAPIVKDAGAGTGLLPRARLAGVGGDDDAVGL